MATTKLRKEQIPALNGLTAPTGDVPFNSHKATGLADGTTSGDAVHFGQIGSLGFLDTINSSSLLEDNVVTESKLSSSVQTKLNAGSTFNNTTATTDPTVGDDSGDGYSVKSIWLNQSSGEAFLCFDASVGAAVWKKTTLTVDELGTLALKNTIDNASIIDNSVITLAKIEDISQYQILGRSSSGSGATQKISTSANVFSLLQAADYAAIKGLLDLEIGVDIQAFDAELTALSGLTSAANKGIYFTGSGTASTFDLTSFGRSLGGSADASAARSTLGIGTIQETEVPDGTVNGTNAVFTTTHTPISGSVKVFVNGLRLNPGTGNDYTISSDTITFESGAIPQTGETVIVDYRY